MALPDSGVVGNEAPPPPSNGGISDMLFFHDTHELVWLEGGMLVRSWMDKTGRQELSRLPGDATSAELQNRSGTGPNLAEDGALAWTQQGLVAMIFFASNLTQKLWVANLSSVPPRLPSHLGPWLEVPGLTKGPLVASDGVVYWGDGASFRSWSAQDALNAAAGLPSSGSEVLAQLGSGSSGWGELRAAAPAHGGGMFWVRNKSHSQLQLELVKDVTQLFAGPEANFISGNIETLHTLLEGDEVSALAVPPAPSAGLPFMGNVTRLFQQVYWSVAGPDMQARIDHLDLGTGEVSTLVYAAGLERRGSLPARPSALSLYPMPDICVNVGCLYLRVWDDCSSCTDDQCDTCFLDTQDWVVKQWYPKHGLFTNCIWLWPADQAAWFVRSEVQKAKEDGRLPEDFVAQELPPDGEATPPGTLPPPPAPVTSTVPATTTSTQTATTTKTSTVTFTSTSTTTTVTNPCLAVDPPGEMMQGWCRSMVQSWCVSTTQVHSELYGQDVNDTLLAPLRLRRECGAYAWTFQELCRPNDVVDADCASCVHPMLWTYAALAAGLALLVAIVLPYLWCVARRRKRSASVSDLGSGRPDEDGSCLADFVRCRKRRANRHGTDGPESRGRPDEDGRPADCDRRRKTSVSDFSDRRGSEPGMAGAGRLDEDGCLSNCVRCRCRRKVVKEIPMSKVQPEDLPELLQAWEVDTGTPPDTSMSNNSPRPSTDAQSKDDAQSAQSIQQILKGTWQPGLSSSGAAAAAGRLTDAMRKFMNPRAREEDKWRILNDVEDILRTLGSALPAAPRGAAWAWHARQTARLHRSNALLAARQEATSMTEDFREDLSQRIVSGVRHLEIEALAGAGEDTGDNGDMHNSEARESLQRAVRLQMEMEQLKTRMDSLKGGDDLLLAGHLLDCREALRRLADQAAAENQKAENNQGDGNLLWKQLASDLEEVQKDLDAKLSSKVPRGWRGMTRSQTGTSEASRWLSRLKEAASRAALFARAVRSRKDKEQLQKLQEQLLSELQSSEAEAAEGGARGDKWKQLHSLWSRLKGELEQAKQLPSGTSQDAASRLTSFVAARRSKLTSQKRSQTQPLGSLAEDVDKAAAEKIREDLEKLRRKVKQLPGKAGSEQQLLMAGFLQLHGEELAALKDAIKDRADKAVDMDDMADLSWQQLRADLEDLEAQLSGASTSAGRLTAGIGSRLLSPKKGGKLAPLKKTEPDVPKDLAEAAGSFLQASEALAKIRQRQLEETNPMLRLGQAVSDEQALAELEKDVATALANCRGQGDEKATLQLLWQKLQEELAEARATAAKDQDIGDTSSGFSAHLPASQSDEEIFSDELEADYGAERQSAWGWGDQGQGQGAQRKASGREHLLSALKLLQQDLQDEDSPQVERLAALCRSLGLLDPEKSLKDGLRSRQAWGASALNAAGTEKDSRSSSDRDALQSVLNMLQRNVEVGGDNSESMQMLAAICSKLGLSTERGVDDSPLPEEVQRRAARLEEQLELQRQNLQRHKEAAAVLAGHSLLHQSLIEGAAQERDACARDCELALQDASPKECERLAAQSEDLQQLWQSCAAGAQRLRQELAEAAATDPSTRALLNALDTAPNLGAALRALARLDDQLEQQRAALRARGRRRPGDLDEATLIGLIEKKNKALRQLAEAANGRLEDEAWRAVYDAWRGQISGGLEQLLAVDISGAGSPTHGNEVSANSSAALEARGRLAGLEEECERRRLQAKRGNGWMGSNVQLDADQELSESLLDSEGAKAKGNELKLLEEQLRRVQSSLGRGGQDSTMAAGLLVHDSALDSIAQQLDKYRRRLAQDPGNKELEAQCDALSELLQGCRGLADAKMREILEGGDPAAAAVLALRRTGKMAFTDDDRQALLEEALRRLARFDDQLERRKATLARRRKRGQSADLDDDDLRQLLADKANALQQLEELLEASGGDPALRQLRDLCRDRLAADLSQLVVSSDGLAGREGCDPSELLAEARRRLAVLEEETAGQRFARRRRASEDPSTVAGMASHIQRLEEQLQELRSRMQRLRGDIGQPDKDSAMLAAHVLEHERSLEDMAHEWQRCQRQLQCTEEDELQAQSDLVGDLLRGCRSSNAALAREIAEASLDDPAIAAILPKRTDKKAFADDDRQALLEEALRRLARFDDQLERQRGALARRRKMGQSADLDDDDLRQLLADKATALETLEELLETSGGDPALRRLRDLCRDRAADLEQLVASSDGRGREGCDPSALLAEARRRLAVLEEETAGQRFARRQRGRAAEKDPSTDAGMASHIQRLEEQLQELRGRMQHVRGDIGQPDKDSAMLAAHVLAHESSLEEMARQWQRCQFHCTEAQSDLVGDLLRGCRSSNAALAREIAEASLDDPAVAAILSKRTDKKAFADDDRQALLEEHSARGLRQALLEEALRRLARFDDQLERQRGALARRRKMGQSADLDDDDLRQLLADKATALETLEELLATSGGDPALRRLRDLCRDRAADLEQLVASSDGRAGREGCDPSALLAQARRRLAVLEEETAGQRFARRRPGRAAEKASSRAGQHGPPKMPLTDDAKARQAALADAARRLACFEEQLDTQRQGLLKRRRAPASEADGVLAAHALLHNSSIDALASERDACYQHCQKLLQEASVESWTEDEKVACQRLAAQCESLSDTWSSCAQSAELLSKDVSKAAPSALTSILRSDADDTQAALAEALRRVARFDHELEQQRSLLQRRPAPNKAMNDAILSSLVEEKKTALAQCEENASDVAWKEVRELWQGPLTSGLEKLTVSLSEAKSSPSRLLEKPDTSAALAEARRRLVTLEEETDRQRVGLRKRGRAEEAQRRKLQQLAANAAEFQEIATEHCQGLKEQQNNLSEAMEKDLDPMEEIEAWRQQVGLEELQAASSRMSEQLATIEEEEDLEASELPADVSSPKRWLSNTNTDTAAAKQQCQVMQARLLEMREDEERERLLLRRRQQQRPVKESPVQAESAARETEESSRDLLLKAQECLIEGNPGDAQAWRHQLEKLRKEAVIEEEKQEPEEPEEPRERETPEPPKPPKEELAAALAASDERLDFVSRMGKDLFSQLEVIFQSHPADVGTAVAGAVERWRQLLPQELHSAEDGAQTVEHLERMGGAAERAAQVVQEVDFSSQRQAFMKSWKDGLTSSTQEIERQELRQQEEMRARAAARRRERQKNKQSKEVSKPRWVAKQASKAMTRTSSSEVQKLRKTGEGFARSFHLHAEQEEEEQAHRLLRHLEERRGRSRPGTAAPSPDSSPLRRGATTGLARTLSSTSAWSPARRMATIDLADSPAAS